MRPWSNRSGTPNFQDGASMDFGIAKADGVRTRAGKPRGSRRRARASAAPKNFVCHDLSGFPETANNRYGQQFASRLDVWMAVRHLKAAVQVTPGSRSGEGRVLPIATVRDSGGPCRLHEAVIGHLLPFRYALARTRQRPLRPQYQTVAR
jgi:hypothetical protein